MPKRRSSALSRCSTQVRRPTGWLLGQLAKTLEWPCWPSCRGCYGSSAKLTGRSYKIAAALERADAVNHAHTHAYAWYYASVLHVLRGEPAIAQAYAERCLAISEQHGFRQWLGLSRAIRGICAALLDASGSGLDKVKAALEEYQRAGYQLGITALFVLMCQALLLRNESEAALEVIDHGLSVAGQNSERAFEAELYRLKASALVMLGARMSRRSPCSIRLENGA